MPSLPKPLRSQLEKAVLAARRAAEAGAREALAALGVGEAKAPEHLLPADKTLRNRLRARGRQAGDRLEESGRQATEHLAQVVGYEHWHRMLFARFLAENSLLLEPEHQVAVSLADVDELARDAKTDIWDLAGRFAQRMLPAVFRSDDPVLALALAPESRQALEKLVADLPRQVFLADDSLGWTYQFWQKIRKEEVNASGVKIGADELSPVTQLFTEDYMVEFLLHNTLGAWWAARMLEKEHGRPARELPDEAAARRYVSLPPKNGLPGLDWSYLRFVHDGSTGVPPVISDSHGQDAHAPLGADTQRSTGVPPVHSDGFFPPSQFFDPLRDLEIHERNLPHWDQSDAWTFVTWRLADSLPAEKLRQWQQERNAWLQSHPEPWDDATTRDFHERFSSRIDAWLDAGEGSCLLRDPATREIVTDALRHFAGDRYELGDFVVMPNHVHVLLRPRAGHALADILHSWKSFTAKRINAALGREGRIWQEEYWDRLVRHERHLRACRHYIAENPMKARLASETFTYTSSDAAGTTGVPPVNENRSTGVPPVASDPHGRDARAPFWIPAAGTFDKWPKETKAVTVLDPCMGSGHFLVFALPILARLRMEEENLTAAAAVAAVLRDNLHGLELDERCTQIAAFNLALAAWKLGGYQPLPPLHLACSGLSVGADKEEWLKLADRAADDPQGSTGVPPVISDPHGQDARAPFRPTADEKRQSLRYGMEQLHGLFRQAPILGSLIDPRRIEGEGLQLMRWDELSPLVEEALTREESDPDISELAVTAKGTAKAAEILAGRFTLVATNVPYLARGKQDEALKRYAANVFPDAKADLATCFVERCLKFCHGSPGVPPGNTPSTGGTPVLLSGTTALVTPQNWLFLGSYKHLRQRLLEEVTWESVVRLGTRAFETIGGEVVNVALLELTRQRPAEPHHLSGLDASAEKAPADKAAALAAAPVVRVSQKGQLGNPDASITFEDNFGCTYLNNFAGCYQGLTTADDGHWRRSYWEMPLCDKNWSWLQTPSQGSGLFGGRDGIVARALLETDDHTGVIRGREAWGKRGIAIDRVGSLCRAVYTGEYFHSLVPVVVPSRVEDYLPIAAFCLSDEFVASAKAANQSLSIDNGYLGKVPFDLAYWQKVAAEKYPNGLPKPYSSDPTQWLFNGHPKDSDQPLHVALARLLGYRWPRQTGSGFPDCPALGADGLEEFADEDGIVCLAPLRGERAAAERLRSLLSAALGSFDEHALIAQAGGESDTLEEWLRDEAFEQHAKLFHHRPFIWHVWDGRPDGFHVLVNYHRLCEHGSTGVPPVMPDPHGRDARAPLAHAGRKLLETLAFSYLGDWIRKQQDDVRRHEPGAEDRQIAAEAMQQELKSILAGEPPYDLFIRWKPLHHQPIGWEPDLNDGVRLNIRPFMLAKNVGRKGAGILRFKPNVNWDKADRGTEPARPKTDFPWFWTWDESTPDFPGTDEFDGNRWNSCHFTNHGKRAARERKENHV